MTADLSGPDDAPGDVAALLARAAAAEVRSARAMETAIDDFALDDRGRLEDRERAALSVLLASVIGAVEREIASHAGRALGASADADRLLRAVPDLLPRLRAGGLLTDRDVMAELLARARQDVLSERLGRIAATTERPSLLVRLAEAPDAIVAAAAARLLALESRRRAGTLVGTELPAELHHALVWRVAAALATPFVDPVTEQAIVDAARRSLTSHDEADRLEAGAMRLAIAIDARPQELGELLLDALGDGRLALFIALLAHASRLGFDHARGIVLDRDDTRLLLLLRAHRLEREEIAQIGVLLEDGDRRRDANRMADALDLVAELDPERAGAALAPVRLPAAYVRARHTLERTATQ